MLSCVLNLTVFLSGLFTVTGILYFILGYETKEKKTSFIIAISLLSITVFSAGILTDDKEIVEIVTEISLLAAAMWLPNLLFNSKKHLTFVWFGLIICSTFDYFESLIASFIVNPSTEIKQIIYIFLYAVTLTAVVSVRNLIKNHIPNNFLEQLSPTIYIVIFFADFSAYYESMLNKDSQFFSEVSDVLNLLSAALIVGCFSYIVYRYSALSYKQKESEIQLEAELKHYEDTVKRNKDIRTFRHDYKNNLYSLNALISSGRNEEAIKYIENLNLGIELSENRYVTGNYLADANISAKADEAKQYNIDIVFDGIIPETGIENSDICTIISNSLDNAIAGCKDSAPCSIRFFSEKMKNGLKISVVNPVREKLQIKNNNIKTTKKDGNNHGFGISNIRKSAQKYNGYADISCDDNDFKIEIGLIF